MSLRMGGRWECRRYKDWGFESILESVKQVRHLRNLASKRVYSLDMQIERLNVDLPDEWSKAQEEARTSKVPDGSGKTLPIWSYTMLIVPCAQRSRCVHR